MVTLTSDYIGSMCEIKNPLTFTSIGSGRLTSVDDGIIISNVIFTSRVRPFDVILTVNSSIHGVKIYTAKVIFYLTENKILLDEIKGKTDDRRTAFRVKTELPVHVSINGETSSFFRTMNGIIVDMSIKGMMLALPCGLRENTTGNFTCHISKQEISSQFRVVRIVDDMSSRTLAYKRCGCCFEGLGKKEFDIISGYVNKLRAKILREAAIDMN